MGNSGFTSSTVGVLSGFCGFYEAFPGLPSFHTGSLPVLRGLKRFSVGEPYPEVKGFGG